MSRLLGAVIAACVVVAPAVRAQESGATPSPSVPDDPGLEPPGVTPGPSAAGPLELARPPLETSRTAPPPRGSGVTGTLRAGLYADGDQTNVYRALGALAGAIGRWTLSGTASVDVVSSASVDVRSSPGLSKVDVVSSASARRTSGGTMSDRRLSASLGAGWADGNGDGVNLSTSYANERDYNSLNFGVNGSFDLLQRSTTLLAGFSFTQNWIGSVLDSSFAQRMSALAWTAGAAQLLSPRDALRLRYDGAASLGYQASPYRNVRFGDWTASVGPYQRITFANTIGSSDGLPETVPNRRVRHAVVLEWVHSLAAQLALYSQARGGIDNWGIESLSAAVELRAATDWWRFRLGYRFYAQSSADFYQSKYLQASNHYTYYTSDKELSTELGHVANLGISRVLKQPHFTGDSRMLLDGTVNVLYYTYPDFVLLPSRASAFVELGVTWEM